MNEGTAVAEQVETVEQAENVIETPQHGVLHEVAVPSGVPDITKTTVLLSVTLRRFEVSRKVSTDNIDVDADKKLIKVHKTIMESPELQAIKKIDSDLRNWLRRWTLPSVLKNGVYMLPVGLLDMVDGRLTEFVTKRRELVDSFKASYETRKAEAQAKLNGLFDASQYPTPDEVVKQFEEEFGYMSFSVPDTLEGINSTIFAREKEKLASKIAEAGEVAQQVIRARFSESVRHMLDRLTPEADGKKKIFRDSMVSNLQEFVDNFTALNVTNDTELALQVQKAKDLISGVDPSIVRTDENFRNELLDGFKQIDEVLETFIVTKASRLIDLED
jgi:hypothetical protein